MKILYINADGGGFADYIEVEEGTTIASLFQDRLPNRQAADYLIRVNRQPTSSDYQLAEGDRVSITATRIEGAATLGRGVCSVAGRCHE